MQTLPTRLFIAKTADMKVLMSGSAVHATKKWMQIYMYVTHIHTYIYCELEVEVERSSGIFSWFHADTFVFVCQTLALSHSLAQRDRHTHTHNDFRSLKLSYWFFVVVIFVGALHRPKWRPRARNCGARSIRNCSDVCTCLSCSVYVLACVCEYVCVTPHAFRDARATQRSAFELQLFSSLAQFSFCCALLSMSTFSRRRGRRR